MRKRGLVETGPPRLGGRTHTKKDTHHPEHKKHGPGDHPCVLGLKWDRDWDGHRNKGNHGIGTDGRIGELLAFGLLLSVLDGFFVFTFFRSWNLEPPPPTPFFLLLLLVAGCLYTPLHLFFILVYFFTQLKVLFFWCLWQKKIWVAITLLAGYGRAMGIWGWGNVGWVLGWGWIGRWEEKVSGYRLGSIVGGGVRQWFGPVGPRLVKHGRLALSSSSCWSWVSCSSLSVLMDGKRGDGWAGGRHTSCHFPSAASKSALLRNGRVVCVPFALFPLAAFSSPERERGIGWGGGVGQGGENDNNKKT